MKNSLALSFIQSTTECFVCPVSFHLTLWDKIFHNAREISHGFVLPVTADATDRVIQVDPCLIWHMLFFVFFKSASNCKWSQKKKIKVSSSPLASTCNRVIHLCASCAQAVSLCIPACCTNLFSITNNFQSRGVRLGKMPSTCSEHFGCSVCHHLGPESQTLTNSLVPSSLSYFTKILVSLGRIEPATLRLTTKRPIALQKPWTEDMHLFTNATSPHNRKKYIVASK